MVIIDSHTHLPTKPNPRTFFFRLTPKELIQDLDDNGIDMAVTMTSPPRNTKLGITQIENDWIASNVKKHPKRLIGLGFTNVFSDTPPKVGQYYSSEGGEMGAQEVERCIKKLKLKGIKLHGYVCPIYPTALKKILQKCVDLKVPLIEVHSAFHQITNPPERIAFIANQYPELTFYLNHMGGPHGELHAISVAKHTPNIVVGTSACDKWAIRYAVKQLGAHRVLWASDDYCHAMSVEFEKLKSAGLTKQEFELVAGENMARILNL